MASRSGQSDKQTEIVTASNKKDSLTHARGNSKTKSSAGKTPRADQKISYKSGTRSRGSGTGSRGSGTGSRGSGTGSRVSGTGSRGSGTGSPVVTRASSAVVPRSRDSAVGSRRQDVNLKHNESLVRQCLEEGSSLVMRSRHTGVIQHKPRRAHSMAAADLRRGVAGIDAVAIQASAVSGISANVMQKVFEQDLDLENEEEMRRAHRGAYLFKQCRKITNSAKEAFNLRRK